MSIPSSKIEELIISTMINKKRKSKNMIATISGVVPQPRTTFPASELSGLKKYCRGAVFLEANFDCVI